MRKIVLIAPNQAIANDAMVAQKKYCLDMDVRLGLMELSTPESI